MTYGLLERILTDNGAPWWGPSCGVITYLSRWLTQLGIQLLRFRPGYRQTQGKDERINQTLKTEVIAHCQREFDTWRDIYNFQRSHNSLDLDVPATRYEPSQRPYPDKLPSPQYAPDDQVRKVQSISTIMFKRQLIYVGKELQGCYVALRPTTADNQLDVFYCRQKLTTVNLKDCPRK